MIYPNPANQWFSIKSPPSGKGRLQILDLAGKVVHDEQVDSADQKISVTNFPKGVYIVKISNEAGHISTQRLIRN